MSVLPVPSFLDTIKEKGLRKAVLEEVDRTVLRMTSGMNIQDIREALRGDPPSRRPNPRLTPHADGFFLHIRPSYYNEAVTGIYPTLRLGWLSTYFFLLEIITGLFLMVFYTPSPDVAYDNMLNILGNVPLGQFMRDLHRLGAEGMVLFVALHMLRTFVTGSYKRPRQFTWFTGSILLLTTLFLSFSGYLLPWDQLAFWAVTIGTSMAEAAPPEVVGTNVNLLLRGAPDIGAGGLLRFYLLHVFALPLLTIVFLFVHYYKVVLHGHSLPPQLETIGQDTAKRVPVDRRVYYIPDVLTTELMWTALVTFLLVAACIWFFHAPLENHADPQVTPLHTTAPWYFLWLQGMLKLGDKVLMGVVLPTIIFGFLFVMPYVDVTPSRRYADRRVALSLGMITVLLLVVLTFMGTPYYGVDTAADQEIAQEMLPGEKVGPIRSVPFDKIPLRGNDVLIVEVNAPPVSDASTTQASDESAAQASAQAAAPQPGTVATYSLNEIANIPMNDLDRVLAANDAIVIQEDNLGALEDEFAGQYPDFFHAIEEMHHLMYDKYEGELENVIGYLIITRHANQDNLKRVQLVLTWDQEHVNEEGETEIIRMNSGATAYVHEEAEWHEH